MIKEQEQKNVEDVKAAKNDAAVRIVENKNKFSPGDEKSSMKEQLLQQNDEDEDKNLFLSDQTAGITEIHQENWKPARFHSYETMALADS